MKIDKSKWKKVKFGEVAIQQTSNVDIETTNLTRYIAGDHMKTENIHLRNWGIVGDGYLGPAFIRKFEQGDILYGSRRTYLKKVAVADFDGITANTTFVIKGNDEIFVPKLLPFLMLSDSFTKHSIEKSKGSVNPYINWKDIANYEFLLPSKEEQVHLAKLLWAVDEVVEREKEVKRRLEETRRIFFEIYLNNKQANHKLGDCLIPKKNKSRVPHNVEKYLGLEHIESGIFQCENYGSSIDVLSDAYIFNRGDLLYSKLRPNLDKAIIADFDGICTTELIVYDTNSLTTKDFILHILHSKPFLDYIIPKGFGTKMPRVSHEIISAYEFYLPGIREQKNLLDKLNKFQLNENKLTETIRSVEQIKSVLINKIF
ncbi:MAG: restriction endonuclease subunit S [Bacteroidales bacterium]|jgi:type I restriction enzyme S subunit|nr:restriction endonuclease subunit S [Bacteroidales bacterium]